MLTEEEALTTFAANSIVDRSHRRDAGLPGPRAPAARGPGFEVVVVDVSEFHKGGGSIRCLTNPVDVRIGRDLPAVDGGEVVVPPVV